MNAPLDQLPLFQDRPISDSRQTEWLEKFLLDHPAWHTSKMIQQTLRGLPNDSGDRVIRQLAAASPWIISGQKGYKHLSHSTAEEINHFTNWMLSQAGEMTRRAETIRRNAHKKIG
jgi:hypothetical protein